MAAIKDGMNTNVVGWIAAGGQIQDNHQSVVGSVDSGGWARDSGGNTVGRASLTSTGRMAEIKNQRGDTVGWGEVTPQGGWVQVKNMGAGPSAMVAWGEPSDGLLQVCSAVLLLGRL